MLSVEVANRLAMVPSVPRPDQGTGTRAVIDDVLGPLHMRRIRGCAQKYLSTRVNNTPSSVLAHSNTRGSGD